MGALAAGISWEPLERAAGRLLGRAPLARVAVNMRPVRGPWGGSSVFVRQLARYLRWRGYEVRFDLAGTVDVVILMDPRVGGPTRFGVAEIRAYRDRHPAVRVLHRVNECDQRKNTTFMDALLRDANAVADHTVFISAWLRDYHAARWFDPRRPHRVIYNGADPRVFHPIGGRPYTGDGPFRVVTHHWSDNPLKGFDVYREVDRLVADGALKDVELWVIGRWPADLRWRAARTCPPTHGHDLARKLRACHAYLTASRWEPAGMHHVEGAQCGLPVLYHEDGGGIVEAGRRYGLGYRDDVAAGIHDLRRDYETMRRRVLDAMPSGDRMCADYADVVQRLCCDAGAGAAGGRR
jgi:glycosyltransferase involved in cell wall biosynthesis